MNSPFWPDETWEQKQSQTGPISVYVHIPFCPTKCGYCDFNSYGVADAGRPGVEVELVARTVDAIRRQIGASPWCGRPAKTIFFGGGTPTFLTGKDLVSVLETVVEIHPPTEDCEITTEANPGTVDSEKFDRIRAGGFNRLSLGAQSFDSGDLIRLGRVHSTGDIERAVDAARRAGFTNLNVDLMFGLPGQSRQGWTSNLNRAIDLKPEHLSLYGLTIEPRTEFFRLNEKGLLNLPDDDEQATMYDHALSTTDREGYRQYEISNFSNEGLECRHNLAYWTGDDYAGYGPGAVGTITNEVSGLRLTGIKHPRRFSEAIENHQSTIGDVEVLTSQDLRTERLMLGLRLNKGAPIGQVDFDEAELKRLTGEGLTTVESGHIRLTDRGRPLGTYVTTRLMKARETSTRL